MAKGATKDMTEGPPLKLILGFFIPMLFGLLFQQLYNMADTIIVGKFLGVKALAAVGSTGSINFMIIGFCLGVCSGFAIPVAQKFGEKNMKALRRFVANSGWLAAIFAVVMTFAVCIFCRDILVLMQTPEDIIEGAYSYIFVIFLGIPATYLYNLLSCTIRSLGDSTTPLIFLVFSSVVNVLLDLFTILVLDMGVAGAALATVISQGCSVLLCCLWIGRRGRELLPAWRDFRPEKQLLAEMLRTGSAMALMLSVFSIGSVILQSAINGLGQTVITAHTAARRIIEMLMQPLSTLATATATFVSQNWGAGQRERIRSALKKVLGLEVGWALLAWAAVGAVGEEAIRWLTGTGDGQVIRYGAMSLQYSFAFYPALGVLLCLRTAMQSMGLSAAPVLSSGIELSGKILGALWIIPRYGYRGASLVEPLTWLLCAAFLCAVFLNRQRALLAGQLCPAEGRCPTENG